MAMRKTAAALAAAVVASSWVAAGPVAYAADTVSDVRLAWSDSTHTEVRVTWTETSAQPNHIWAVDPDGTTYSGHYVFTDDANSIDVPAWELMERSTYEPDPGAVRQVVVAIGEPNEPNEPDTGEARSVRFDAMRPPQPVLEDLAFDPNGGVVLRWRPGEIVDVTPDDPLDVPRTSLFVVYRGLPNTTEMYLPQNEPSAATTFTVPGPQHPNYGLSVTETGAFSWPDLSRQVQVNGTGLRATVPSAASYGSQITVSGVVSAINTQCEGAGAICSSVSTADPGHRVVVQARKDATSAWTSVGSTTSGSTGAYSVRISASGTRQYRAVAVNQDFGLSLRVGTASAPTTTRVSTRVLSAGFADSTVTYGAKVTARVSVSPAVQQRATLQRRDLAGVWRAVKWVYLKAGKGSYTFTATQRGSSYYRFAVPGSTVNGLAVDGVATAALRLAVSS